MSRFHITCRSACILLAAFSFSTALPGAELVREAVDDRLTIVRMTIDPAPAPEPALQYRLLPSAADRVPGNAVPLYHRALADMEHLNDRFHEEYGDEYQSWFQVPLDEFPMADARRISGAFAGLLRNYLIDATQRTFADWGFQEELLRGEETITFLLPEIQATRSLGRMLAIHARAAIIEGRYRDAVESFRVALQMARDISTCKFIVCDLVAIATASSMDMAIEEYIASAHSPNLYWAFAALPDPLIFGQDSLELELDLAFRMFPWLDAVAEAEYAPDEWRRLFTETLAEVESDFGRSPLFDVATGFEREIPEQVQEVFEHGLATLYALKTYPAAKDALIAAGMPAEQVEQMPVAQVLSLQTARAYRYIADEMEKRWHVPFPEAGKMEGRERELMPGKFEGGENGKSLEPIPLAETLLPATVGYRAAHVRLRRQMAAFAVIEALRMHAAQSGRLPEKLADVQVVPVPENPATGEPFQYQLEGDTAVLLLPAEDGLHLGKRYEIKLR